MQKLAAYRLERRDDLEWPEARLAESERIRAKIQEWVRSKGASSPDLSGSYDPEDGSDGRFRIQEASDGDRAWWALELVEETGDGRRVRATISVTSITDALCVYATLETGFVDAQVMPVSVDPRCPRVVRDLLRMPGRWYHGQSQLHTLQRIGSFEDGEALAYEIMNPKRSVPVLVLSKHSGKVALDGLENMLAHDLAGLANVFVLEDAASWALTDFLGPKWSCYWGAVRLYWPHFSSNQDRFEHPLWTAERLQGQLSGASETESRFRRQLRGLVFRASAVGVRRPRDIDRIRDAASRRTLEDLRSRASSQEEYQEIASSYAKDNDELRTERENLRSQIEELEQQVGELESEKQALLGKYHSARSGQESDSEELSQDDSDPNGPPTEGEVRFYKKTYSARTHDVMVRIGDCAHGNWEGAHRADKARKGIKKIEGGRDDWKAVHHCASCTGGGVWKVRW